MKQLSDLRRARGLIQQAYSKIIGKFGTNTEVLDLLTEALSLIKAADVPGGVVEVEEPAGAKAAPAETKTGYMTPEEFREERDKAVEAEPPPKNSRQRSMGKKGRK
jgi:hypothetical protein